ncbi:hypothetical protein P167DRAFT_548581 [Morchella conica CCBAS932]|uniref:Uncharacterized protein n=1 Tax=Morchella conica CCBAS932 TaxID=1392247 RepID=A0A3N4KE42_9PEZI|nr:hypothetical protein P167DRAFT_548581 [Morchella conica CCBAS932]
MQVDNVELDEEQQEIARHNALMARYQAQRGRVCNHYYCGRRVCIFWEDGMPATDGLTGPNRAIDPQRMTGPNAIPTTYRSHPDTDSDNSADSYRTTSLSDNDSESENQMALSEASKKAGRARGIARKLAAVRFSCFGRSCSAEDGEEQRHEPARSPRSTPRAANAPESPLAPVYPPMSIPRPTQQSMPVMGAVSPPMTISRPVERSMATMGPVYSPISVPRPAQRSMPAPEPVESPVIRRQHSIESFTGGQDWGYAPNPNYSQYPPGQGEDWGYVPNPNYSQPSYAARGSGFDSPTVTTPPSRPPAPPLIRDAPRSNPQFLAGALTPPLRRPETAYTPQQLREGIIHSMTVINVNELPNNNPNISSFHVTTHQIGDVARREMEMGLDRMRTAGGRVEDHESYHDGQ